MKYVLLIGPFLLTACITTQKLPAPSSNVIAHDMVRITLARNTMFIGGGVSFTIKDEGVVVGKLGNYNGRLTWDRPINDFCLSAGTDNKPNTWKDCFRPERGAVISITFSTRDGFNLVDFNATKL